MLAESYAASDGGRRYTIALRKGVRFHNGKEMTSADVVASLTRWGKVATLGKTAWRNIEAIEAKDPSTVVIHLKQASSAILFGLAEYNNAAAIYPKEVVDAAGDGQVKGGGARTKRTGSSASWPRIPTPRSARRCSTESRRSSTRTWGG